jgi:DNA primase
VALITSGDTNEPIGITRTYLNPGGAGKAPVEPNKMMLGRSANGAVRLAASADYVMIGEGIETCLAVMQATGKPAWAALSTSGLRSLELPASIQSVDILADGDPPGEAAARAAAQRLLRCGGIVRTVRIVRAGQGHDFNDMLINPDTKETRS